MNGTTSSKRNHHFTGVHAAGDELVFVRGVLKDLDEKRVRHTFVMRWAAGSWSHYIVHNNVTAQCTIYEPMRKTLSLGFDGSIHVDEDGRTATEHVDPSGHGPNHLRWMWDIRTIGRSVYAVGMLRMIYRRIGAGRWIPFNTGAELGEHDEVDAGLRSVDGLVEHLIYAVGLHGEIWRCDGQKWAREDSPTNVRLERVRCIHDDLAYACGGAGVILRGTRAGWTVVPQNETDETFWDMTVFRGELFFATKQALYVLDDRDELTRIDVALDPPLAPTYLDSSAARMWSVGEADIATFDGERWQRPNHPLSSKTE